MATVNSDNKRKIIAKAAGLPCAKINTRLVLWGIRENFPLENLDKANSSKFLSSKKTRYTVATMRQCVINGKSCTYFLATFCEYLYHPFSNMPCVNNSHVLLGNRYFYTGYPDSQVIHVSCLMLPSLAVNTWTCLHFPTLLIYIMPS